MKTATPLCAGLAVDAVRRAPAVPMTQLAPTLRSAPIHATTAARANPCSAKPWRLQGHGRLGAMLAMGVLGLLLGACQSKPPQPDWQINAKSASERFVQAQLSAHTRTAQAELALARRETASTGRIDLAARLELLACAVQVASVDFADCPAFESLAQDAAPPEHAYAAHLKAQPLAAAQIALLPVAQQRAAQQVAAASVAVGTLPAASAAQSGAVPGARATGEQVHPASRLDQGSMDHFEQVLLPKDPDTDFNAAHETPEQALSRLVAAGVLMRAGLATPDLVEQAVQTASHQGWRRPLLAWLGVQAKRAELAGERETTQRIHRRMRLVAPDAPASPNPSH